MESGGTYGARRITRALRRKGHEVARCTVERLMVEPGIEGVIRGRRRHTTIPEPSAPHPPDLVDRGFAAFRRTSSGCGGHDLCPHLVRLGIRGIRPGRVLTLDVYSRMIVGWPVACRDRSVRDSGGEAGQLDLLAWMPMLTLTGLARLWEPKRPRLRLFPAATHLPPPDGAASSASRSTGPGPMFLTPWLASAPQLGSQAKLRDPGESRHCTSNPLPLAGFLAQSRTI